MWTVYVRDQTARSVQSDLDVHCPQKLPISSTEGKELKALSLPVQTKPSNCLFPRVVW